MFIYLLAWLVLGFVMGFFCCWLFVARLEDRFLAVDWAAYIVGVPSFWALYGVIVNLLDADPGLKGMWVYGVPLVCCGLPMGWIPARIARAYFVRLMGHDK